MSQLTIDYGMVNAVATAYHIPQIKDNVGVGSPLLQRLMRRVKRRQLGKVFNAPLRVRFEGGGGSWYGATDTHDTTVRDPLNVASFFAKNSIVPYAIDEQEELEATTPEAVLNLLEEKSANAEETMNYLLESAMFNNGTNPKAIGGLQYALPYSSSVSGSIGYIGSQTYGNISCGGSLYSSDTQGFWQPHVDTNGGSHYTTGSSGTFMYAEMNPLARMLARQGIRAGRKSSLIVSNEGAWTDFHNSLVKNERYDRPQQNSELAKSGFQSLMYRNLVWITSPLAPRDESNGKEYVYLIDESAVNIYWDPRRDFFMEPFRKPYNQSVRAAFIKNRLELCFRERRTSGMISVLAPLT